VRTAPGGGWTITLAHQQGEWGEWQAPSFDVLCDSGLQLKIPHNRYDYRGRSHSLWFGDVQRLSDYGWFETAFMTSGFLRQPSERPFALNPGEAAAKAVWQGMAEFQVAWPFTPLIVGELDEFIDRWAGWFADAAEGRLNFPASMPERNPEGSWRRT
jgi:serine/threonine-protein kinase